MSGAERQRRYMERKLAGASLTHPETPAPSVTPSVTPKAAEALVRIEALYLAHRIGTLDRKLLRDALLGRTE